MDPSTVSIIISLVLVLVASGLGIVMLKNGNRSKATFLLMAGAFVAQSFFLYFRGELRGKCPLGDWAEILVFIAWSLSIFYMVIGPAYRVSLLGFFSAPLVSILCAIALIPGVMEANPERIVKGSIDAWGELHAALAVLSYGAFALGTVSACMFLALDKKLKGQQLSGGLFENLPPVFELVSLTKRLLWVGLIILSAGILSSFKMENVTANNSHLLTAVGVWIAYLIFLLWMKLKGMTPRVFAKICVVLFVVSLIPF